MDLVSFNDITQPFIQTLNKDAKVVEQCAIRLYYYLALIQLVISALWMILAGEGLERMFNKLVIMAFHLGVFYACLQHGGEWIALIINGFIEVGQMSGVGNIDPGTVMSFGLKISGNIIEGVFKWGLLSIIFTALFCIAVSFAITMIYALIAAEMIIVLVKSYFLVSLSSLFFAFAGSELTRDMSVKYFKTVIGIGLQLMTLYFLVGVGQALGAQWVLMISEAVANAELMPILSVLASVIIYYLIVKNIPVFVASLSGVGGFRNYGESAIATSLMVGAAGAAMVNYARDWSTKKSGGSRALHQSSLKPVQQKEKVPPTPPPKNREIKK